MGDSKWRWIGRRVQPARGQHRLRACACVTSFRSPCSGARPPNCPCLGWAFARARWWRETKAACDPPLSSSATTTPPAAAASSARALTIVAQHQRQGAESCGHLLFLGRLGRARAAFGRSCIPCTSRHCTSHATLVAADSCPFSRPPARGALNNKKTNLGFLHFS